MLADDAWEPRLVDWSGCEPELSVLAAVPRVGPSELLDHRRGCSESARKNPLHQQPSSHARSWIRITFSWWLLILRVNRDWRRWFFSSSSSSEAGEESFIQLFMLGISRFSSRCVPHSSGVRTLLIRCSQDPGPYLIAIPSESRAAALADLPPEVAVVDIDSNLVTIKAPQPGALSSGSAREKARRRLEAAIGQVGGAYYGVPAELTEAFPAGRFRPFSEVGMTLLCIQLKALKVVLQVEVRGVSKEAERLRPAASWDVRTPLCPSPYVS